LLTLKYSATYVAVQGFKALYPPGGGRAAVEVVADDLNRLAEMEFLNDTIIDYYMK
jgi:Ulp1 family protease